MEGLFTVEELAACDVLDDLRRGRAHSTHDSTRVRQHTRTGTCTGTKDVLRAKGAAAPVYVAIPYTIGRDDLVVDVGVGQRLRQQVSKARRKSTLDEQRGNAFHRMEPVQLTQDRVTSDTVTIALPPMPQRALGTSA